MSIKKLFEDSSKTNQFLADVNQKDAFENVESHENIQEQLTRQKRYVPHVDYSDPANFVKYGSARLYYESAFNRILDYYPYDGSQAEITKFHNENLDIEEYILNERYPRSTGYITLAKDGYSVSSVVDGYGAPTTNEYIDFKGGPGTGSATSALLKDLLPNPDNDNRKYSNIYSTNIYTDAGLISNYGTGTRQSNLRANFDDGVTIEFWLKTGSVAPAITEKQVIFDSWNSQTPGAAGNSYPYGRIRLELDSNASKRFVFTVESGSVTRTSEIGKSGSTDIHSGLSDWKHYAISFQNSGSSFVTKFYINGEINETVTQSAAGATATITITNAGGVAHGETFALVDASGVSTTYLINGGGSWDNQSAQPAGGTVHVMIGGAGGGVTGKVRISAAINSAINLTTDAGFTSVTNGVDNVTVTQSTTGPTGDKTNTDSIGGATVTNFTGGTDGVVAELNSKNMVGRIGALVAIPSGSSAVAGSGRLTGSIDEFRYWKSARTAKQIGEHWFTQVRGGANSDVSNADLGVYYKFNEGITADTAIDSIVLDYAGRATNGKWVGYTAGSRNTGSAIVSASASAKEFEDPIIRSNHASVVSLKSELVASGTFFDYNNNASLFSLMPGWVQDEVATDQDADLHYVTHIAGTYFDKLHMQISQIPKLRHQTYTSSSYKPLPFAQHLPQSLGLYTPELFIDSTVLERFADRDSTTLFENKIEETKNIIYQNLYNNLSHIFKSKGTERSLRSILRCFGIDNGLYTLKINSNNEEYVLRNNFKHDILKKNFLNFASSDNARGVVYSRNRSYPVSVVGDKYYRGSIRSDQSTGVSSTNPRIHNGFTCESNILFPAYSAKSAFNRDSNYNKIHLFGIEQPDNASATSLAGTDTTYLAGNSRECTFRVYAVRESEGSKNVYFHLTSSRPDGLGVSLTSSVFLNVYDNEPWNLSIRIQPKHWQQTKLFNVPASSGSSYDVIFAGFNPKTANEIDTFKVTQNVSQTVGESYITGAKRIIAGADRENVTGAINYRSDVLVGSVDFWNKSLHDDDLKVHSLDFENKGISGSLKNMTLFATSSATDFPNMQTWTLSWNFNTTSSTDATGSVWVDDFSSGSYASWQSDSYGWLNRDRDSLYEAHGVGFATSSGDALVSREINTYKFIDPEQAVSSDMVQTWSDEDILFPNFRKEEIVPNYVYSFEKSIYNAVSEQMLDFFAGAIDFHDILGQPVHGYRHRYKDLEKLRETFFRRVKSVTEVEKFITYYKWFDETITTIMSQMVPASSEFIDGLSNVIESHVLERNKYQNRLNVIDSSNFWVESDLTAVPSKTITFGPGAGATSLVSPPASPRPTNKGVQYWKTRAERTIAEISSGDATVDSQRETFRNVIWSRPNPSGTLPRFRTTDGTIYDRGVFSRNNKTFLPTIRSEVNNASPEIYSWEHKSKTHLEIKGGTNFNPEKSLEYAAAAVKPGGPINTDNGKLVPQNVLLGLVSQSMELDNFETYSWPSDYVRKREKTFNVQHGRDWEDGIGYKNTKSQFSLPFNVLSSSVEIRSGFNKEVIDRVGRNLEITNIHNDVYGYLLESPMQGPFTDDLVGGHQSRHVALNRDGTDQPTNRPEAWRILLGTCTVVPEGAIGVVGPDYPPANYNPPAGTDTNQIYPYPKYEKAYLYRDFISKSPVNIKNVKNVNSTNTNTVPGNYTYNHQVLYTFGAFNNPRHFIKQQPALPVQISQSTNTTNIRTILGIHRGEQDHFETIGDYDTSYLEGTSSNSVIITRFAAPGGIEVETKGYQDFKSSEYSPYNALTYRNLSVKKPSQGPSGSISEPHGGTPSTSRVYDIHGQDYGLNSHRARHAARFGRDSLNVLNPGASYDELPAMFKINRNTKKLIRGYTTPETYNQNSISNTYGLLFSGSTANFQHGKLYHDTTFKDSTGNAWSGKKFTLSAWIYLGKGLGNQNSILTLGDNGQSLNRDQALGWHIDSSERPELWIQTSTGNKAKWRQTTSLATGSWYHVAVVYDGASSSNEPTFYMNGVSQSMTLYAGSMTSSMQSINNVGGGKSFIGASNRNALSMVPFVYAALDEVAIYDDTFSASEITTLYSSGGILNLTASFAPKSGSLATWLRLGDSPGDPITNAVMTQSAGTGPTFYDVVGNNNYYVKAGNVANIQLYMISASYAIAPVSTSFIIGTRDRLTTYTSSMYDNYNISHPIPRSDRQYMWISSAVVDVDLIRYSGYQRTQGPNDWVPYRSSSAGIEPFWNFVSSSNANTGSYYQPTNRLNIIINDPIDTNNNTAGTASVEEYINYDLIGSSSTANLRLPNYLNQLLASRGSNYGWGWNRTRQADNRFIINQKKTNILNMVVDGVTLATASYRLPPVSMKGRTALINIEGRATPGGMDNSTTLRVGNTNNAVFFNEYELNDYANINYSQVYSPASDVLTFVRQTPNSRPNWVMYSQNIFPSVRNEFASASSKRLGYDNLFWRTDNSDRRTLGSSYPNSFGAIVSQSSWILDAPYNFLTRSAIVRYPLGGDQNYNIVSTSAGELQNTYYKYFTTPIQYARIGAVYARTHELDTMASVVSPQGPKIPETGSMTTQGSASFEKAALLAQPFGGEAAWDAPTQAGYFVKDPNSASGTPLFTSASSEPWFGNYDLFNENIKLKARGFSVVPEYRMSEHVSEYYKFGLMNESLTNMFEIPGTIYNSSTGSFYKDFSNTDFLEGFLGIRAKSLLNAKEIRISCTGAIKYNPYEGFYPAQRTEQLVAQFSSSHFSSLSIKSPYLAAKYASDGSREFEDFGAAASKALFDCVFSPGILYNSIKSGIAVDYPVVDDTSKRTFGNYGTTANAAKTNNYALAITGSQPAGSTSKTGYFGGQFWDRRIPFEGIIDPVRHLANYTYHSMETHPSMSIMSNGVAGNYVDSYAHLSDNGDNIYSMMAQNFFGQTCDFFLKDSSVSILKSKTVTDDLKFKPNEVYMARIKMRRSHNGKKNYAYEYDSEGYPATTNGQGASPLTASAWHVAGAKVIISGSSRETSDVAFPVPQDPKRNPFFQETFTMYSRPTAFGPSCAGRPSGSDCVSGAFEYASYDSFEGYNPAFTPPYTNGEAWVDLIFRPSASVAYDLERILAETKTVSWRFDAGYRVPAVTGTLPAQPSLIPVQQALRPDGTTRDSPGSDLTIPSIYDGYRINVNSMQLTSSVDIFGVERILEQHTSADGSRGESLNKTVGKKWLISTKWETPMLNFADTGEHPISNAAGTLSLPLYASASVPRGMWHQFGVIPTDSKTGVFLEIGDIPTDWLKNHYKVTIEPSAYNGNNPGANDDSQYLYKNVKSLSKLCGFDSVNSSKRIGELKDSVTIREAVVAIPYILEALPPDEVAAMPASSPQLRKRKKFISIPKDRYNMTTSQAPTSAGASSLGIAGESVRKLRTALQTYVFPPQFDFVRNSKNIDPFAMYVFEFKYKLNRDDLSYIWQNLAPKDYKKLTFQDASISHNLGINEILTQEILVNPNLRWMVFKVKQRAMKSYQDLVPDQAGSSTNQIDFKTGKSRDYSFGFNWPYDYLSFVELVKIDVDILLKK